ncbi:MAG: hypothetical protein C4526_00720 [Nitrospiraceae bacterium]|nr:MAG: hypothetical protein C4526_00720 [Nitrospiraceae bacterium]
MKASKSLLIMMPVVVILLGIIIYQYGYLRVQSEIASIKEEQDLKSEILGKYVNLISQIPRMEKELLSRRQARDSYNAKFLAGDTDEIAAAALLDLVRGILSARGGKVSGGQIAQPSEKGIFRIINISVDAVMPDVSALSDAVYTMETHTPQFFIRDMDVRIKDLKTPRELIVKLNVSAMTAGK